MAIMVQSSSKMLSSLRKCTNKNDILIFDFERRFILDSFYHASKPCHYNIFVGHQAQDAGEQQHRAWVLYSQVWANWHCNGIVDWCAARFGKQASHCVRHRDSWNTCNSIFALYPLCSLRVQKLGRLQWQHRRREDDMKYHYRLLQTSSIQVIQLANPNSK